MHLTAYLQRMMSADTATERAVIANRIARRALDGGDVDSLLKIVLELPGSTQSLVRQFMGQEMGSGYQMLYARLWLRDNYLYDMRVSDLRAFIRKFKDCDDYDEIIEHLEYDYGLVTCDDCGEYELSSQARAYYNNDDATICRRCIDNGYTYSNRYDMYVYGDESRDAIDQNGNSCVIHEDDDEFQYNGEEDEWQHVDYSPNSRIIGTYHSSKSKQRPQASEWTKLKNRYLGVELEVEINTDRAERGDKAMQLHDEINGGEFGRKVFFENDGSISNGFEIISQPMGLDKHRELWGWLKDKDVTKGLRSHNTTTCGLHVHVSRAGLSKLQIAKIVAFVNSPDNEDLIRAVARRYAEGYCRIKQKKIGQSAYSEDRYEAVNICPQKTIEFRIFKGSLKYESVMAAIEFSNAVVDFCARAKTSINDLKADRFLEFINTEATNDTEYLRPYLANRLEAA